MEELTKSELLFFITSIIGGISLSFMITYDIKDMLKNKTAVLFTFIFLIIPFSLIGCVVTVGLILALLGGIIESLILKNNK
jgi:hypothetical protein